jgi:phosphatidylserine/phosphatidylglycerophosphate/cardiolipin synthase-like enzyme
LIFVRLAGWFVLLARSEASKDLEIPGRASQRCHSWEPFVPTSEDAGGSFRHVFTYPGSERTIKEAALELVREARSKIFVASFLLGEPELLDVLFAAAGRLCGGVYVVSEPSDRSLRQRLAELEEESDPDAAAQTHKKNFAELARHGIAVRGRPDCHAKFIVTDDRARFGLQRQPRHQRPEQHR